MTCEDTTKPPASAALTVDRIVHTELPALSDENVASFGMEGVQTVRDLRRALVGKQVESFILEDENTNMASAFVWQEVAKNSEVARDPEEYAYVRKTGEQKAGELQNRDGVDMDLESIIGLFVSELDLAAIGAGMMEQEGKTLTTDDYTSYIDRLAEAYPDRARAAIEDKHTVLDYAIEQYSNYLAGAIDRYVAEQYKMIILKEI